LNTPCRGRLTTAIFLAILALSLSFCRADQLEAGFIDPPRGARLRAYWWWLNGNVTKAAITRDLEQMKEKGFGGALICDAGGATQDGNAPVPHGPTFFTAQWRELYKHALREADRLGLEMSLNIQSGWNLGGPMVKAEDAPKKLTWSTLQVEGSAPVERALPQPPRAPELYRDLFILAYPVKHAVGGQRRPIQALSQKTLQEGFGWSAPDSSNLLRDYPDVPGEEDTASSQILDLSTNVSPDGKLHWEAPAGRWEILRVGYTLNDHCRVSTCSDDWGGYAIDPIDGRAFKAYWQQIVEPLIADAGPLAGKTLKYLHTDSWEVEMLNWTPTFREEFKRRRGYDLLPFIPVITGRIVDSRSISDRFLHDFRRTIGDLAVDNHFKLMSEGAHRHGMQIHPESGGPHCVPVDSLQCLGMDDAPMSEFWARSPGHRVSDNDRFFMKQPASAAHTYGRKLVLGEGLTDIGLHWQETLWDNLKPSFDRAACEGLNLLVWHAFVCSPNEMGLPGQQYFAGTHFNPNTTWWSVSAPFLSYINRTQSLLQRGLFVADVCYYYGDHVPNFTQLKRSDPARIGAGYDYDVITEEALIRRMGVQDGRIVMPDGMSYRLLVLPRFNRISPAVLRSIREVVNQGATVIGPKPTESTSLANYPKCDEEVLRISDELWGGSDSSNTVAHAFGKGRVISGISAREVLLADGTAPDFEPGGGPSGGIDYIHRKDGEADIYFVCNRSDAWENISPTFRVAGKSPEIWLPDTGEMRRCPVSAEHDGRTTVPIQLEPFGSAFVVFRSPTSARIVNASQNGEPIFATGSARDLTGVIEIREEGGKWSFLSAEPGTYSFRDAHNRTAKTIVGQPLAPETLDGHWTLYTPLTALQSSKTRPFAIDGLKSWTTFPDPKLKYFSGTLTYTRELEIGFDRFGNGKHIWLDLGKVSEIAEVELNGQNLGILWKHPTRLDITTVAKPGKNQLTVRVTNFWPNRIIGDQLVRDSAPVTQTNIRKLTSSTPLMPSGLLGPVRLLTVVEQPLQFQSTDREVSQRSDNSATQ
jgi:hypothetical protein